MRATIESRTQRTSDSLREWVRGVAEQAQRKAQHQTRAPRRLNREKDLFAQRAQQIKALFQRLEAIAHAINREAASSLIATERALNPKNLGGIEVPDAARIVLKFLERRIEIVVNAMQNVDGRPAAIGALAAASVILYDASDPSAADWFEVVLREDGWHRKSVEDHVPNKPPLGEKDLRQLIEWLVG